MDVYQMQETTQPRYVKTGASKEKSNYKLYLKEQTGILASKCPFLPHQQITKKIRAQWTKLSKEEKLEYGSPHKMMFPASKQRLMDDPFTQRTSPEIFSQTTSDTTEITTNYKQLPGKKKVPCYKKGIKNTKETTGDTYNWEDVTSDVYDITSPDPADQEDEVEEFVTGRAWKTYHGRWDKPFLQHPMPEIVDDTPSFQPGILIRDGSDRKKQRSRVSFCGESSSQTCLENSKPSKVFSEATSQKINNAVPLPSTECSSVRCESMSYQSQGSGDIGEFGKMSQDPPQHLSCGGAGDSNRGHVDIESTPLGCHKSLLSDGNTPIARELSDADFTTPVMQEKVVENMLQKVVVAPKKPKRKRKHNPDSKGRKSLLADASSIESKSQSVHDTELRTPTTRSRSQNMQIVNVNKENTKSRRRTRSNSPTHQINREEIQHEKITPPEKSKKSKNFEKPSIGKENYVKKCDSSTGKGETLNTEESYQVEIVKGMEMVTTPNIHKKVNIKMTPKKSYKRESLRNKAVTQKTSPLEMQKETKQNIHNSQKVSYIEPNKVFKQTMRREENHLSEKANCGEPTHSNIDGSLVRDSDTQDDIGAYYSDSGESDSQCGVYIKRCDENMEIEQDGNDETELRSAAFMEYSDIDDDSQCDVYLRRSDENMINIPSETKIDSMSPADLHNENLSGQKKQSMVTHEETNEIGVGVNNKKCGFYINKDRNKCQAKEESKKSNTNAARKKTGDKQLKTKSACDTDRNVRSKEGSQPMIKKKIGYVSDFDEIEETALSKPESNGDDLNCILDTYEKEESYIPNTDNNTSGIYLDLDDLDSSPGSEGEMYFRRKLEATETVDEMVKKLRSVVSQAGTMRNDFSPQSMSPALSGVSEISGVSYKSSSNESSSPAADVLSKPMRQSAKFPKFEMKEKQGKKDEDSYESSFDEKDKELLCSMFYDLTPPETKQAKGSNRRIVSSNNTEGSSNFHSLFNKNGIFDL